MTTMVFADRKFIELIENERVNLDAGGVSWKVLNKRYRFNKEFKNKYIEYFAFNTDFNWYYIATNILLPEDYIRLNFNELIKYNFGSILVDNNISIDFIREYKDIFTIDNWGSILHNCWVITKYLRTKELREVFWREFSDYIDDIDDINRCVLRVKTNKKRELGRVQRYCKNNNII